MPHHLQLGSIVDARPAADEAGRGVGRVRDRGTGRPSEARATRARARCSRSTSRRSMKGEPLAQVIRSVDRLLDALGGSTEASGRDRHRRVLGARDARRRAGPRRRGGQAARALARRASSPSAATNIEAGLDLAARCSRTHRPAVRRGVILLSDGAPNVGAHTAEDAARGRAAASSRASRSSRSATAWTTSEDILSAIGDAGGGGYEFVAGSGDVRARVRAGARRAGRRRRVRGRARLVARGRRRARSLRRREETRFSREGVIVSLPDMVSGARRLVVAELAVTRRARSASWSTSRRSPPAGGRQLGARRRHVDVSLEVADREPVGVPEAARAFLLARADEAREAARALARSRAVRRPPRRPPRADGGDRARFRAGS